MRVTGSGILVGRARSCLNYRHEGLKHHEGLKIGRDNRHNSVDYAATEFMKIYNILRQLGRNNH